MSTRKRRSTRGSRRWVLPLAVGAAVGRGPERALHAAQDLLGLEAQHRKPGYRKLWFENHGVGTVQQVVVLDQEKVARTVDQGRIDVPFGFGPDYWWVPVVV